MDLGRTDLTGSQATPARRLARHLARHSPRLRDPTTVSSLARPGAAVLLVAGLAAAVTASGRARWAAVLDQCPAGLPAPLASGRPQDTSPGAGNPRFLPQVAQVRTEHLRQVAQIGGATYAVTRQGLLAYVGVGTRLLAVDVSDPTDLAVVGQSPTLPGVVRDVTVVGHLAFVAADRSGLQVVDVSNPSHMSVLGSYETVSQAMALAVSGNYAFLAASKDGLLILDVGNPASPHLVGSLPPSERLLDIALADGLAYVVDRVHAIDIVDVRDPEHPSPVGHLDAKGHIERIAVAHGYVFATTDAGEFRAVSVADPEHPAVVSSLRMAAECGYDTCSPPDVFVAGDMAYVTGNGLAVFDISEPAHMRAVNEVPLDEWDGSGPVLGALDVSGGLALAAADVVGGLARDSDGGLVAFDVTEPAWPRQVGRLHAPGDLWRPSLTGVPDGDSLIEGNVHVDVAAPASARYAGLVPFASIDGDVAMSANLAYATNWDVILQVFDLTDIARPAELARLTAPAASSGWDVEWVGSRLAVAGELAFVAGGMRGSGCPVFAAVNVQASSAPRVIGTLDDASGMAANVERIAASADGRFAYLAEGSSRCDMGWEDGPGHLQVVDATDPEHPRVVGDLSIEELPPADMEGDWALQGGASDMALADGTAYVAAERAGLWAIDLSDPTAPRRVGVLDYGADRVRRVAADWPYVFASVGDRIVAVDVTDPGALRQVASVEAPGEVAALTTYRGLVWAAVREAGLVGLELWP
jgi:hypothetical protein